MLVREESMEIKYVWKCHKETYYFVSEKGLWKEENKLYGTGLRADVGLVRCSVDKEALCQTR